MKKKILVAGGTGYIGSHTTVELQNAGYEVVIIDDLSNSNIEVLDGIEKITGIRPEFIQLDLKDKEGTRKALEAHPPCAHSHIRQEARLSQAKTPPLFPCMFYGD